MSGSGTIIVVSAPSGAGKTMLIDFARSRISSLVYSISATTRPPRAHEVNGIHYHFMTMEDFQAAIDRGEFAEWQEVHGNYYGTPRRFVEETIAQGKHVIMDIDVYGKKKFDAVFPQCVGILVLPPSMEVLERRLRARQSDSDDAIRIRLENARKEIEFAETQGRYQYRIINGDREQTLREFAELIRASIAT